MYTAKIETFDLILCKVSTFSYFRIRVLLVDELYCAVAFGEEEDEDEEKQIEEDSSD